MDADTWAQLKEVGARDAWQAAREALAEVRRHLKDGKPRDARDAALSFAILVDKSGVLEAAAAAAEAADYARRTRIENEQAHVLASVISTLFAALGVPLDPARPVLAALLRQASAGEPLAASEDAAAAARGAVLVALHKKEPPPREPPPMAA